MFIGTKRLFVYSLKFANYLNSKVMYQDWLFFRHGQFSSSLSVYAHWKFLDFDFGGYGKVSVREVAKSAHELKVTLFSVQLLVLKYVQNKDVFMRYHKAHLTRRLILDISADSEIEENMVEWLRVSKFFNICFS